MLEQHERGPVPAGKLGPDLPGRLGDQGGRRAGLGDHGQVARLRTGRQPHPEVSNTLPIGGAGRVAPERFVGDQLAEQRQALLRRWRENRSSLPAGWWAETSIDSLLLSYVRSILVEWLKIITGPTVTGCSVLACQALPSDMPGGAA